MLTLITRNLRTRPARTLFTAFAIALGVGMIFAMRIVGVALAQSAEDGRSNRLAGADLEITNAARANIDAALAGTLAAQPDVLIAAPTYTAREGISDPNAGEVSILIAAPLKGTGLTLLGIDPDRVLTPYELADGSFLSAPTAFEVLLPQDWAEQAGLSSGDMLRLTTAQQTHDYTVIGLLKTSDVLQSRPMAWLPIKTMQTVFDTPAAATTILLRLNPTAQLETVRDRIQTQLGSAYIVTSATSAVNDVRSPLLVLGDLALPFAGLAVLLAGSFLVYNAFGITLAERRREIGQLRTLGMTRQQVMLQTLGEALLVALLGSGFGLLLGLVLGRGMMEVFVGILQGNDVPDIAIPFDGVLLAVSAGMLVTLAVTFNLARRAARVSPLIALQDTTLTTHADARSKYMRWGWLVAAGLLIAFIVVNNAITQALRAATSFEIGGIFLPPFILAAVALFILPTVMRIMLWSFGKLTQHLGASARIAHSNLIRNPARAVLTSATLTVGLMLVVALSGITLAQKDFFQNNMLALFQADFFLVRPLPSESFEEFVSLPSLLPIEPDLQAELDQLMASDQVELFTLANAHLPQYSAGAGLDNVWAADMDIFRAQASYHPREGSWDEAERIFAEGPALTLPEFTARRSNIHVGDSVPVDTIEGPVMFKVALIGGPLPLMTRETGERYFKAYPFIILINAREGVATEEGSPLYTQLADIAKQNGLSFLPDPQSGFANIFNAMFDVILTLFAGLTSLSGIVAGLGIVNTLIASVLERQREIGTLRALGMSRTQVRRVFVIEAGALGLTGALVGVCGGIAISIAFVNLFSTFGAVVGFGSLADLKLPWLVIGAALIFGPLMAMLAALYPADRAANADPAEAMRAEGSSGFLKSARRKS